MYQDLKQQFWWNAMRGDHTVCSKVSGMPISEIRISEIHKTLSAFADTRMEVKAYYYRL